MNSLRGPALALCSLAGLITTATAAVLEVPAAYPDIPSALGVAFSGDTVLVEPGSYHYDSILTVPAGVALRSSEGRESTTIVISDVWAIYLDSTESGPPTTCSGFRLRVYDFQADSVVGLGYRAVVENCEMVKSGNPMGNTGALVVMANESIVRKCFIGINAGSPEDMFRTWGGPAHGIIEDCEISSAVNQSGFMRVETGSKLQFRNNTFTDASISITSEHTAPGISIEFIDNLFVDSFLFREPGEIIPDELSFRHNVYWESNFSGDPEDFFVGGVNNFEADPLFCDAPLTHWIQPESPCIGAGETGGNIGARLGVCGITEIPEVAEESLSNAGMRVWPNPSHGVVEIRMGLGPVDDGIDALILGVDGRHLATLGSSSDGIWRWDGKVREKQVANGSYVVALRHNGRVIAVEKLVLSR